MKRRKLKHKRVNPKRMITAIRQTFKPVVSQPKLKNMILTTLAIARAKTFRINEISRHLPVAVACEKTRQKRLLRFIEAEFPLEAVCKQWLRYVMTTVYGERRGQVLILIDETKLIDDYIVLTAAIPFRQRAVPIAFFLYKNQDIQSMKYVSHNTIVQQFTRKVNQLVTETLPSQCQPVLVFDRGFDRAQYLINFFNDNQIRFIIRACKNTGLVVEGEKTTLRQMPVGSYPQVLYQLSQRIGVSLYVAHDESFDDPMYLISNCVKGLETYHVYRRRMQVEQGFRDIKTTFGFGQLQLKKPEQNRVELLWLMLCISCGLLMLQYEKSGYRWSREFNGAQKDKSLIWVIKQVLREWFSGFQLHWNFSLPVLSSDIAQLGLSGCFSLL